MAWREMALRASSLNLQADILEFEEALVLLDDRVLGPGQDFDQRELVQVFQYADHGQAADKLGNQAQT